MFLFQLVGNKNLHFFTAQVTLYDGAVGGYLPKALSAEELEAELRAIIAEVGAASAKDMGKVMGVATKRLAGRADGKDISTKVKELLG